MAETDIAWLEAFKKEHGWYPWEDPNLAQKGFSPEQAYAEHTKARQLSQGSNFPGWEKSWQRRYGYTDQERPYLAGRSVPSMQAPAPAQKPATAPTAPQATASAFRQADQAASRPAASARNLAGATADTQGRMPMIQKQYPSPATTYLPNVQRQAQRPMAPQMPMIQKDYQQPQAPAAPGMDIAQSIMQNNPRFLGWQKQYGQPGNEMPMILKDYPQGMGGMGAGIGMGTAQQGGEQHGAHLTMMAQQDPAIVEEIAQSIESQQQLSQAALGALVQHAQKMGLDLRQLLEEIVQQELGG